MSLPGARPIWLGLAASALLHAGLLTTDALDWPLAQVAIEPPPIEFRLQEPAPQPVALARPQAEAAPVRPPRSARPPAKAAIEEAPAAAPESQAPQVEAPAPADEAQAPSPPEETQAEEAAEAPPALNPLPRRIDLEYRLSVGPASGRQTLVWVNQGDGYTVTSVAEATGLTRVFYSGRFVQTSRGRVTPRGLQPEEFWDQRGDRRSSAHFDAASGTITLNPAKGAPRHFAHEGGVQDALSLFFQLALTAPPADGQLAYRVFNGKKLRDYMYEVRGEEMLETALGEMRTLHLARLGGDGRFEAWLAIDRHYLPVRVLRVEDSGAEGELAISTIAPSE